jgi:hypothetical protein
MKIAIVILAGLFLASCSKVPSNDHVISTNDCGKVWEVVETGDTVHKHTGNPCGFNTALPNFPMVGDTNFKAQFSQQVLSNISIDYSYSIVDPIKFIDEARYLAKMGNSLEISAEDVASKFEMAENIIIDKLLREELSVVTRTIDIVDANPSEIEELLFQSVKDKLASRGVTLTDITLVVIPSDETKRAIDVSTALRVYRAAGMEQAGTDIMKASAGASRITVTTSPENKSE